MEIPGPGDCLAVVGVPLGILGGLVGLILVLSGNATLWGFVLLALSGWVSFTSVIFCLAWEWEHFAPSR
jgi:hypothetical protein